MDFEEGMLPPSHPSGPQVSEGNSAGVGQLFCFSIGLSLRVQAMAQVILVGALADALVDRERARGLPLSVFAHVWENLSLASPPTAMGASLRW